MDQVFRTRLKNFRHNPPEEVWDNIQHKLEAKKDTGILWYRIAASIAVLMLIASFYFYVTYSSSFYTPETSPAFSEIIKPLKHSGSAATTPDVFNDDVTGEGLQALDRNFLHTQNIEVAIEPRSDKERIASLTPLPVYVHRQKSDPDIIIPRKQTRHSFFADIFPEFYTSSPSPEDYYSSPSREKKKWMLGGAFAPAYSYRHLTESSTIAGRNYYNNIESAVFSYSGGVNIQYKPQKRLTVQAGVYYSTMGQDMDHISVYANSVYPLIDEKYRDRYLNSYQITNSAGDISISSPLVFYDETVTARVENLDATKSEYNLTDPMFNKLNANLRQSFEYIEVPLIFRYKLVDKMIDINLIGGVGANFLVGNSVYLIYENSKDVIGKTNGVNDINYSGSFGLGLEYPILNNVNILIEPSIKYYLNPINSNSAVESHPYSLGIYTGVSYSF
jgi:hypothetical protein